MFRKINYKHLFFALLKKQPLYKVDANSTHEEFLKSSISFLLDSLLYSQELWLLEFGTGGKSSILMREFLEKHTEIKLYSFESNIEWLEKHKAAFPINSRHKLIHVENGDWSGETQTVLKEIPDNVMLLSFIDSHPWNSRVIILEILRHRSDIFLVHDCDYFPHNNIFGIELDPIQFKPTGRIRYGKLKPQHLGERRYEDVAKYWMELFPIEPGYFTGPPTLIASNRLNLSDIILPKNSITQSKSKD